MENPPNEHRYGSVGERLTERIDELERRVAILERSYSASASPAAARVAEHPFEKVFASWTAAIPTIGKLFLGLAGAYVLRAVNESGSLPQLVTVLLGLAYAVSWLFWASRSQHGNLEAATSATTAALIFSPMVWELTLRFRVLPAYLSAATLFGFIGLGSALAWKHKLSSVAWIATFLPAVTALMLLVATRDPLPFVWTIYLTAVLTELAGACGHWRSLRPFVALLADFAVLLLTLVYSSSTWRLSEYTPIGTSMLVMLTSGLFVIYATSSVISTVVFRHNIRPFEVGQMVVVFALALINAWNLTHDAALPWLSAFCIVAAAACYLAALSRFSPLTDSRNYHVFATWGAVLLLIGIFAFSRSTAQVLCLDFAAVAATLVANRFSRVTLGFHAAAYLMVAGYLSGLWGYATDALVGPFSLIPNWKGWVTAIAVIVSSAILWRRAWTIRNQEKQRSSSAICFLVSFMAAYVFVFVLIAIVVWIIGPSLPSHSSFLAVVRTFCICVVSVLLTLSGARWSEPELVWIAYSAMAFCTLKLLFEDLRHGTAGSIAVSLSLYGMVWVLVPRLLRSIGKGGNRKHLFRVKTSSA